ncbi:MAG: hypothetical protein GXO80_12310 [Chlorobi bacterium]|nr:hypothetical protein [Chlorobiota bacterium]
MKTKIIIDNDSLVNLTGLEEFNIYNLLRNIFTQILIPTEVKKEYEKCLEKEPKRRFVLERLRPNEGFWSLCTRYDSYSNVFLFKHKGIDKGEAEIISQSEKTGEQLIISDDVKFKAACENLHKNVRIYNTLFVLAILDIHSYLNDSVNVFKKLYKNRQFKHNDLIEAYNQASKELRIQSKKVSVSKKTIKKIIKK